MLAMALQEDYYMRPIRVLAPALEKLPCMRNDCRVGVALTA